VLSNHNTNNETDEVEGQRVLEVSNRNSKDCNVETAEDTPRSNQPKQMDLNDLRELICLMQLRWVLTLGRTNIEPINYLSAR